MSDLISRQAAIDALHMHLMYRMGTDSNKKRLDDWINGVPSVQPEKRTEERAKTYACDLIDREAAVDAIYHHLSQLRRGDERGRGVNIAEELAMLKNVIKEIESRYCENCQEWDCDFCRAETDSTERRTDG